MAEKNWMIVIWNDIKEMPEVGSSEPISPRGKLILNETDFLSWEKEEGNTIAVAYHQTVPLGFGVIENGEVNVYSDPIGNAVYGHGSKKRAKEMIETLLSAFRRYAPKEQRRNDSGWSNKPKKTRKKSSASEIKDQTPSYKKRTKQNSGWNKAESGGHMALHQVCKHEREGCWCTIKATGKRYWRSGGTVRGHWRGEGADKLNAKL